MCSSDLNNQKWVSNEWYVVDLFAGRGSYADGNKTVSGSPLIFLETIAAKKEKLRKNLKVKLFFVEKDKGNLDSLKRNISKFLGENTQLKNIVQIEYFNDDCNKIIKNITDKIENTNKHPLFILIDPTGLQIKKTTMEEIVRLSNRKDIILNYILEGVRRTGGIAKKAYLGGELDIKQIKTLETLKEFIGEDVDVIKSSGKKVLEDYVSSLFTSQDLRVVAYDMK